MYKKYKRVFLIVLDSVGIGHAPDEESFGDIKVNTLLHTIETAGGSLPNLSKMGLLNLIYDKSTPSDSYYTRARCVSNGKDTLTGHLEIMGVKTEKPF